MATGSMALLRRSRAHLAAAGESYVEHLRFAMSVGALMVAAGLACLLHALFPGILQDKASRTVERLSAVLSGREKRRRDAVTESDAPGLLALVAASLFMAVLPWAVNAETSLASSFSLLAFMFPAAALYAEVREDEDGEALDGATASRPPAAAAPRRHHVAIVGAGFSGTMLAVHLAADEALGITLIDRRPEPGKGLAYATDQANHLLNVRAARMSAYPDDPGHFARWLAERGLGGPVDFAPRRVYGAYLEEQLAGARARAGSRLSFRSAEARDVRWKDGFDELELADGGTIRAEIIVLASGNLPPPSLPALEPLPPSLYRPDPWSGRVADGLGADDVVLLVGTGLTMIDTVVALTDAGFEGRILAVSRRGLLPRAHGPAQPPRYAQAYPSHLPVSNLLGAVRRRAEDIGWRAAIDELRPSVQGLWRAADADRRARFLRHLRPWWDVHRHRIAPAIADRLAELQAQGRFTVVAGKICGAEAEGGRASVQVRLRATGFVARYEAARIVNCTGAEGALERSADPLLNRLLAKGAIRPDAQRLGLDTDDQGRALSRDGRPTRGLLALGPIARGRLWEATAVPELRVLSAEMARTIGAEIRRRID